MSEFEHMAEIDRPWKAHDWPCPGFYVGNHEPPMLGLWSCTCRDFNATGDGLAVSICRCEGGPYLGARKAGTPCCCERCGFLTENQRAAIVEGNDRMHRALQQAKDRALLDREQRLALVAEAACWDRPYDTRIEAIREYADLSTPPGDTA